jgi:hypothetical protein
MTEQETQQVPRQAVVAASDTRRLIDAILNLWNSSRSSIVVPDNVDLPGPIKMSAANAPEDCSASPEEMLALAGDVHALTEQLRDTGNPAYRDAITTGIYWEASLLAAAALCSKI